MPRRCQFTDRRTHTGRTYTTRGKKKYLGGVGTKVTGKTKRKFRANLHDMRVRMPDGSIQRVKASAKAVRSGMVVKPLKRKYAYKHESRQSQ